MYMKKLILFLLIAGVGLTASASLECEIKSKTSIKSISLEARRFVLPIDLGEEKSLQIFFDRQRIQFIEMRNNWDAPKHSSIKGSGR
jgi:hypothetical protein